MIQAYECETGMVGIDNGCKEVGMVGKKDKKMNIMGMAKW